MNDNIEKLKELFKSDNPVNHVLAIELAINTLGMTPLELAKKYNEGWFIEIHPFSNDKIVNIELNNYTININSYTIGSPTDWTLNKSINRIRLWLDIKPVHATDEVSDNELKGRIINYIEEIINKTLEDG